MEIKVSEIKAKIKAAEERARRALGQGSEVAHRIHMNAADELRKFLRERA